MGSACRPAVSRHTGPASTMFFAVTVIHPVQRRADTHTTSTTHIINTATGSDPDTQPIPATNPTPTTVSTTVSLIA